MSIITGLECIVGALVGSFGGILDHSINFIVFPSGPAFSPESETEVCVSFGFGFGGATAGKTVDGFSEVVPIEHVSLVSWRAGISVVDDQLHVSVVLPETTQFVVVLVARGECSIRACSHQKHNSQT